jgi:hypothetical protein
MFRQGLAKRGNMHAEADLIGAALWPNTFDQGSPADDLVRLLHQDDEQIHGARTERHNLCAIRQEPVTNGKLVRAEAQGVPVDSVDLYWISRSRRQLAGL